MSKKSSNKKTTEAQPEPAPVAAPAKAPAKPKLTDEQAAEIRAWAHAELERLVPSTRPCGCGCEGQAKGRFLPGHDAKLVSRLIAERTAAILAA